jgi:uracil-DNA glycosylase
MAVFPKFNTCKRRYDLQFFDECVCVEFPNYNGPNLLIGNRCFSPDLNPDIICECFSHLENKLDTLNYRVILLGDFNVPVF